MFGQHSRWAVRLHRTIAPSGAPLNVGAGFRFTTVPSSAYGRFIPVGHKKFKKFGQILLGLRVLRAKNESRIL
jgi:hypothetical protein